jgi:hypothetical protein
MKLPTRQMWGLARSGVGGNRNTYLFGSGILGWIVVCKPSRITPADRVPASRVEESSITVASNEVDTNHAGVSPVLNIELGWLVTLLNIEPEGGGGKSLFINPQYLPSDRGQNLPEKGPRHTGRRCCSMGFRTTC